MALKYGTKTEHTSIVWKQRYSLLFREILSTRESISLWLFEKGISLLNYTITKLKHRVPCEANCRSVSQKKPRLLHNN
jgi:hypothetical protein